MNQEQIRKRRNEMLALKVDWAAKVSENKPTEAQQISAEKQAAAWKFNGDISGIAIRLERR